MKKADATAEIAIGNPVSQCARGDSRSHPYRYLRPASRQRPPNRIAGAQVHALRDEHHQRQANAEHREEQVEAQRGSDLGTASREVADGCERGRAHYGIYYAP